MANRNGTSLYGLVGPAILQALQLARYQALKSINKNVVEVDENDVIGQKPTPEEERIMVSNAAVVSTLEDLFSWIHKDKTQRTSQLSYIESWRFHRAMYRVWIMSTLYGSGSPSLGQRATGASSETQMALLQKFTSQELVQLRQVSRFLTNITSWAILAERKPLGSLDFYTSDGLSLFAGPHIVLRCYEERSSDPLPFCYLANYESNGFLLPSVEGILKRRNITIPLGFVGTILDEICGASDTCRACGRNGLTYLPASTQCTPDLYSEKNWARLESFLGAFSEIFLNLTSNEVENPLFETLRKANYDTLFRELFAYKGEQFKDWTEHDWFCAECMQEFFKMTVFRWWRERKVRDGESVPQDCRHGYLCKDQCFKEGLDHARRFNHLCGPVDESASLAHYHSDNH